MQPFGSSYQLDSVERRPSHHDSFAFPTSASMLPSSHPARVRAAGVLPAHMPSLQTDLDQCGQPWSTNGNHKGPSTAVSETGNSSCGGCTFPSTGSTNKTSLSLSCIAHSEPLLPHPAVATKFRGKTLRPSMKFTTMIKLHYY